MLKLPRLALYLVIVLLFAACGPKPTPALTPVTVQLAWTHQAQFAGFYAAEQNGYYAAEGLAVTFVEGGPGADPIGTMLAGAAQFGISASDMLLIGRSEGKPVSAIAWTVAGSLQEAQPDRQVEFVIQPGLNANGDPRLLEIALTNLLGNAFKFTGKTPQARIQFGQTEVEGQRAFFVRDNGAGFDMALANKLFGAFQRMHKASDFPGTGIGLATVQRIVHRHGGRIWAEAAVDQGATFYFTLEERL
jgi:signal transduction histidine kinase